MAYRRFRTPFMHLTALAVLLSVAPNALVAQSMRALRAPANDASVKRAVAHVVSIEPGTIESQIAICQIPSPPFRETARAEDYARRMRALGLRNVRIDSVGNVIGERPGDPGAPAVVVSGHLDTVFPEGTDVTVKREGSVLRGPGIADDCRGLAMVLAVAEALETAQVKTRGTIYFVGTVGEEGPGNLRGVRHLLGRELRDRVAYFISIDSEGLDHVKDAVGSYRYRVTFKGPGGHSFGDFGMPNPMHALGRAIAHISDLQVTASPKTTFSVGIVEGGTTVNSIASSASFEIDMRSETADALNEIDGRFRAVVQRARDEEHSRGPASDVKLTVELDRWGERPAGKQAADSPIIAATIAAARAAGFETTSHASSTDANMAIGMGIPGVTIGTGGRVTGSHSLNEAWDSTDSQLATKWAVLLVATLAGVR